MSALMGDSGRFDRRSLVAELLKNRGDSLIVGGLGASTWDLAAAGEDPKNIYLWGAMGLACSIGLGLAMAQPEKRVVVITGDGEMMMGVGSLATIANAPCTNLGILILDNQAFGETGQQAGLTAGPTDICTMAKGAGLHHTMNVHGPKDVRALGKLLFEDAGPSLAVAKIELSDDPLVLPTNNAAWMTEQFRQTLGLTMR